MSKNIFVTLINFTDGLENMKAGDVVKFHKEPVPLDEYMIIGYANGKYIGKISHIAGITIEGTSLDSEIFKLVPNTFEGTFVEHEKNSECRKVIQLK